MGEDAFWAAREGDALLHSSFAADFISSAFELAATAAVGALAVAAVAGVIYGGAIIGGVATIGAAMGALSCSTVLIINAAVGIGMAASGLSEKISQWGDQLGNWLSPPTIQGHILTGSPDTRINSKRAARAAGVPPSRADLEMIAAQQAEDEAKVKEAERLAAERPILDRAADYLRGAGHSLSLAVQKNTTLEGAQDTGLSILKEAGHFVSEMWQPTVASATPSDPRDEDKIDCHKHPATFSDFCRQKAANPLDTALDLLFNPLGALEIGFQALSGVLGSAKGLFTGKEVAEYIAEGARDVRINSQPAARSNVRCTCEAKVTYEPENGKHVSNDVRIGGPLVIVRDIKSGKSPIALVASIALAFMGKGRMWSKLTCFLQGVAISVVTQKATQALINPVDAASGAKYLAGDEDLDFSLPGHYPLDWQRLYNSRSEAAPGLFGVGWRTEYEVSLERTPGAPDERYQSYIDPLGRRLVMDPVAPGGGFYCPEEGLAVRRGEDGHWLMLSDDGTHRLFEPDPTHPERQRLRLLGDRNRNTITLHYDAHGRLTDLVGELKRPHLRLVYDPALSATHAAHRRPTHIERCHPDNTQETLVRYRYDTLGQLTEVRTPDDQPLRQFAYDAGQRMILHRLPEGEVCHYRWAQLQGPDDTAWRVIEHWTGSGEHYHLHYNLPERALKVSDSLGRTRYHQWNAAGQITRYQDELNRISRFVWSEARQLLAFTDAEGSTWRYTYDRFGHLTETHDPLGRATQTTWHTIWHAPLTETNTAGHTWRHVYDEQGNRLATADPERGITRTQYDTFGQPIKITDARGGHTSLLWNEDGQLMRHSDCSGALTHYFYDARGQLTQITHPSGERTTYQYNERGQLIGSTQPDGGQERYSLTPAGQLTARTDATGARTGYTYDARGLVCQRIDAAGRRIGFEHDAYGRLTALVNENAERYRFTYDAADQLIEQTDLDGRPQQLTYDARGDVIAVRHGTSAVHDESAVSSTAASTAANATPLDHTFIRDALGRLITKHTGSGSTSYHYDPADNLCMVRKTRTDTPPEKISFTYNKLGDLLSETTAQGTLKHTLDKLGNRCSTTFPDGRAVQSLTYGSGHIHQINLDGEVISDFERDVAHREIARTQGQLSTLTRLDALGRVQQKQTCRTTPAPQAALSKRPSAADTLIERDYTYGSLGQLLQKNHSRQGRTDYRYDPTGRITRAMNPSYWQTLNYDAAANLLDEVHNTQHRAEQRAMREGKALPPVRTHEVIAFNRIRHYKKHQFTYDAQGRIASKSTIDGTHHYRYDAEQRLIEVAIMPAGMGASGINHPSNATNYREDRQQHIRRYGYVYDALGRRTEKHQIDAEGQPFNRTQFLWDGLKMVQEKRPGGSNSLYLYTHAASYEPLARVDQRHPSEKGQVVYFHTEINGAPEEVTNAQGEIVWEASYQIWGNTLKEVWHEQQAVEQNLRYQGQYLDRETGLHYNTFRYYDPDIGRFTTPDPIGLAGGLNLYQYAPNAIGWIDPWGWAYSGVDFTGSPDLFSVSGNQKNIVQITMQGSRRRDFVQAYKAAGIKASEASGYTWHHGNDFDPKTGKTTMQLVKRSAHEATFPHAGSVSQFEKHFGLPSQSYGTPPAIQAANKKGWIKGRTPKSSEPSKGCQL